MKIFKAFAEFNFVAVNRDRAERGLDARLRLERQVARIRRQEPLNVCVFQRQISSGLVQLTQVNLGFLDCAEQPRQEVEEMNADIGDDAAGAFGMALPRDVVPRPARRDVGQAHRMAARPIGHQPFAKGHQLGMHAQLQDGLDGSTGLAFELLERVEIPRVDHQGLLANRVGAGAQGHPHVGIMEVIRRADADVVDPVLGRSAPELLQMPIEALDLIEEAHFERKPIEHANRIVRVRGSDQAIAGVMDRLQMARRNIAAYSRDGKVLHLNLS